MLTSNKDETRECALRLREQLAKETANPVEKQVDRLKPTEAYLPKRKRA